MLNLRFDQASQCAAEEECSFGRDLGSSNGLFHFSQHTSNAGKNVRLECLQNCALGSRGLGLTIFCQLAESEDILNGFAYQGIFLLFRERSFWSWGRVTHCLFLLSL